MNNEEKYEDLLKSVPYLISELNNLKDTYTKDSAEYKVLNAAIDKIEEIDSRNQTPPPQFFQLVFNDPFIDEQPNLAEEENKE